MSNLTNNTSGLRAILEAVNNLPEASSGGGGGSGGGSVTQGVFSVVDNGMYEPGVNEYVLSNSNLESSIRNCIIIYHIANGLKFADMILFRENSNESFRATLTQLYDIAMSHFILDENSITVYGNLSSSTSMEFLAY